MHPALFVTFNVTRVGRLRGSNGPVWHSVGQMFTVSVVDSLQVQDI